MKVERIVLIFLTFTVLYLLLLRNDFTISYAQEAKQEETKIQKKYTMKIPTILVNELDAVEVNANHAYIRGYDLLRLQLNILNILRRKGIITKAEGQAILDQAKKEVKK